MIAIIDYGMGNLRSVQKAFEKVGADAYITDKTHDILRAKKIVLPGVGAIQPAVEKLQHLNLVAPIKESIKNKKPFLGICLGLQLLFEKSDEGGQVQGLGILKGEVRKFSSLKVPQIGWNQINIAQPKCLLFDEIKNQSATYFCHSYYVSPQDKNIISSTTDYGIEFCSSICSGNLYGVQFHPEKSQDVGLKIIENFVKL